MGSKRNPVELRAVCQRNPGVSLTIGIPAPNNRRKLSHHVKDRRASKKNACCPEKREVKVNVVANNEVSIHKDGLYLQLQRRQG